MRLKENFFNVWLKIIQIFGFFFVASVALAESPSATDAIGAIAQSLGTSGEPPVDKVKYPPRSWMQRYSGRDSTGHSCLVELDLDQCGLSADFGGDYSNQVSFGACVSYGKSTFRISNKENGGISISEDSEAEATDWSTIDTLTLKKNEDHSLRSVALSHSSLWNIWSDGPRMKTNGFDVECFIEKRVL